jgi:hypothetical protein
MKKTQGMTTLRSVARVALLLTCTELPHVGIVDRRLEKRLVFSSLSRKWWRSIVKVCRWPRTFTFFSINRIIRHYTTCSLINFKATVVTSCPRLKSMTHRRAVKGFFEVSLHENSKFAKIIEFLPGAGKWYLGLNFISDRTVLWPTQFTECHVSNFGPRTVTTYLCQYSSLSLSADRVPNS